MATVEVWNSNFPTPDTLVGRAVFQVNDELADLESDDEQDDEEAEKGGEATGDGEEGGGALGRQAKRGTRTSTGSIDDGSTITTLNKSIISAAARTTRSGATRKTGATEASNARRVSAIKKNLPRGATFEELALARPNKPAQGRLSFHWTVGPRRPTTTTTADRKAWKVVDKLPPALLVPPTNLNGLGMLLDAGGDTRSKADDLALTLTLSDISAWLPPPPDARVFPRTGVTLTAQMVGA